MGVQQSGLMFRGRFFPAPPPLVQPCSPCWVDRQQLVPCKFTVNGVGLCSNCAWEYERDLAERQSRAGVA